MEGGGSRAARSRSGGTASARRVSSVARGAPGAPAARSAGLGGCRPRWPHRGGAALPLSPRVPGSVPEHSRLLPRISLPPPPRSLPAPQEAGQRGSRGLPSGTGRRLAPLHPRGGGHDPGGSVPPLASPPQVPSRASLQPAPCRPTQGEGRPPPEQGLCSPSARGGLAGHSTPPAKPGWRSPAAHDRKEGLARRALRRGGRREPGPESRERSPSPGKLARGEDGNPRPGGHSPFRAQRGQGGTFRRCPRLPPEHGPGWGPGTPGGGTVGSRAPQVPTGPRPGLPALFHCHHHLSWPHRGRGQRPPPGPISPSRGCSPQHRARS